MSPAPEPQSCRRPTRYLVLVQTVTLSRVAAMLLFAGTALNHELQPLAISAFLYALMTDVADGHLARRFHVATEIGGALDGFADKFVTLSSTLYLLGAGIPLLPGCIILTRDLLVLSFRYVRVENVPLFPPRRLLGGLSGVPVRLLALVVLVDGVPANLLGSLCWLVSLLTVLNVALAIRGQWNRICQAFKS